MSARVDDVRAVLQRARDRLGANGHRTMLFIDEIHRFDKRRRDSVPAVEEGLVTLIGATTKNPYFQVDQALLSRCSVIELEPLTEVELARGARPGRRGAPRRVPEDGRRRARAAGRRRCPNRAPDARARLGDGACERRGTHGSSSSTTSRVSDRSYRAVGYQHYDWVSAFIKIRCAAASPTRLCTTSQRCSRVARTRIMARRIVIAASEDVGNADPQALVRRRRRRPGPGARRAPRGPAEPRPGRDLRRAGPGPTRRPVRSGTRARTCDARRSRGRRCSATPSARRPPADTASGTSPPADDPRRGGVDHLPESLRGRASYVPSGNGEEGGSGDAPTAGERAPEFDLEEASDRPRVRQLPSSAVART